MKRILFAYPYCNQGGVASVIKSRLDALRGAGFEPVLAFEQDAGGLGDWTARGVRAEIFPGELPERTVEWVKREGIELVTVIDTPAVAEAVADETNARIIYEVHSPIDDVIRKAIGVRADALVVPSAWSKRQLVAMGRREDEVTVVPNVVPKHADLGDDTPDAPTVLWVGKLSDYKNWRDALAVFARIAAVRQEVSFRWVTGAVTPPDTVREFLARMGQFGLNGRVEWLHHVPLDEMGKVYGECARSGGVLLSTSNAESFCLVVHEAFRAGLPAVASAVGPLREIIDDGTNGFLFEPHDIDSAADRILSLLEDEELYPRIVKAAHACANTLERFRGLRNYIEAINRLS